MRARPNDQRHTRLNLGQIQCMLLVDDHLTSKEIAKRLGISPHTVDQRVRHVLRLTGAASRREAARIIKCRIERGPQHKDLVEDRPEAPATKEENTDATIRHHSWMLPFSTYDGQLNDMGFGQRLFWIVVIAVGGCVSTAMYLAGLESLGRVLRAH